MSDNEIREKKIEKLMQREERKELVADALCWACWAVLGCSMFFGAFMIGG